MVNELSQTSTKEEKEEKEEKPTESVSKEAIVEKLNASAEELKKIQRQPSLCNSNLARFRYVCKDLPSPSIFIDFDFYFLISSCLARKVWIGDEGDTFRLYPNLFIICVADPGIGKSLPASAVSHILDSLVETRLDKKSNKLYQIKLLNLAPDAITYEKLVLRADASSDVIKDIKGSWYQHSSSTFCLSDEMGMLFTENTKRVVYFLTQGYDCRKCETDTIKHGPISIRNICLNFLGCCTPKLIKDLMRTRILEDGFTARTLFIYGDKKRQTPTKIKTTKEQKTEIEYIQDHLRKLCKFAPTQLEYSKEADEWLHNWTQKELDKHANEHPILKDYYGRRQAHLIKMAINIHFADNLTPVIELEDFIKAKQMLNAAEVNMHKALAGTGENPMYEVSEEIKKYIEKNNGHVLTQRIKLDFYSKATIEDIEKIIDFLVNTEQCNRTTLNGRPSISLNN